jgi:hypothetical protein
MSPEREAIPQGHGYRIEVALDGHALVDRGSYHIKCYAYTKILLDIDRSVSWLLLCPTGGIDEPNVQPKFKDCSLAYFLSEQIACSVVQTCS